MDIETYIDTVLLLMLGSFLVGTIIGFPVGKMVGKRER